MLSLIQESTGAASEESQRVQSIVLMYILGELYEIGRATCPCRRSEDLITMRHSLTEAFEWRNYRYIVLIANYINTVSGCNQSNCQTERLRVWEVRNSLNQCHTPYAKHSKCGGPMVRYCHMSQPLVQDTDRPLCDIHLGIGTYATGCQKKR